MRTMQSSISGVKYHILILFFLSVCLGQTNAQDVTDSEADASTLFYPSLPDAPRIQYLTSFKVAGDVREKKKKKSGWLSNLVLGEEDPENNEGPEKPYGVSVNNGQVHVVDTRGGGYAIFDVAGKDYRFILGSGSAVMTKPVNIEVDSEGTKYVTDTQRGQILSFDRDDKFLMTYGKRGEFRSDTGNFRVQKYTRDGEFVQSFGIGVGDAPGNFARPKGIDVDRMGRLYVVDAAFGLVQIFDKDGQLLLYFGEPGSTHGAGLDMPAGIDIDYDSVPYFQQYADPNFKLEYIIAVANQFGRSSVTVFGFGRYESMSYDEE